MDSHKENVCRVQLKQIYRKNYTRSKDRRKMCQWLVRNNMCVGDRCRFYNEFVEPWINDKEIWRKMDEEHSNK